MKKIFVSGLLLVLALPAMAQSSAATKNKNLDPACMQTTLEKRDNTVISAWDTFTSALKSALSTRTTALKSAWSNTNVKDRRAAIKTAWAAYSKSAKDARKALNAAKNSAWKQFITDRKACGPGAASEDGTGASVDTNL